MPFRNESTIEFEFNRLFDDTGTIDVAGLAALSLFDVRKPSLYVVVGVLTWICVLKSGVHATLVGVAVGFAMPLTRWR